MSKGTTYAVIIRADHHAAGRYLASCPDIPGWFATGASADEASSIASEIVRGIVAERRTNGLDAPEVSIQATQVVVDLRGDSPSAKSSDPIKSKSEAEEAAEEEAPGFELDPIVSSNEEPFLLEDEEDDKTVFLSSEPLAGKVLKAEK